MFERKTATSASTTSEAHQNNYTTTTSQVPSLSINSSNHLPQGSEPQHLPLTNSPSNLSILRDYKHHQQQQGNNNNNTSPQSPPHSPRQNSNHQNYGNSSPSSNNNTTGTSNNHQHNHNTNKRLSIKLGSSNSNKRLSVNLLLNKLGGGGGGGNNEQAALQHHLQQYSSSMMMRQGGASNGATNGISSGGANHQMNSSGNTLIGNLDSMNNVLMTREGSQILLGVPYKEGLGYRKTSHWPYRYNKRYFVLKNHHLRIYRAINDYQQHQQYSSIVKHALKQQQHGDSNMNGNVVAINNIINNNDLYNSKDDSNNLSNHSIVTQYSSFTSNMITTPSGDMIPKVDTSSFMLYKIPLKYCKIFKFHTSTNESSNLDYRSSASEMNPKDVPSKSFAATDKKEEKKEDDEEEEFELHFLPPTTYTGPGVTGQKAYKLHDDGDGTNNMSSSPSSVLHGDEVATGSGANSAIFKLKFKGTANDWFNLLDKAIFLASKTGDNEEEDVWKQEQKKDFDEEEWLSQYKKEQQQDMMDLPVFLRPLQMQIKQHNDEMLIDHQEKQKQISAEKNMSLKKRLSQYFSSGSAVNNANTNKRNSGLSSYTVSEKPFDMKSDNLVDSISESTTSHNSTNEKRKSGYVIDDSIPDITDMSQLQDLIRQHDDDDDYTQPSQPKFASDHKTSSNTNAISTLKTEEKKGSALHRLSTNLSELFSKKKQPQPSSSTHVPDNSDTISVDGKKEKRKSVFGRLLNINKEK